MIKKLHDCRSCDYKSYDHGITIAFFFGISSVKCVNYRCSYLYLVKNLLTQKKKVEENQ